MLWEQYPSSARPPALVFFPLICFFVFFPSQQEPGSLSEYASLLSEQYPSFARTPASVGNLKDLMNEGIVKDYDDCKAAAVQTRKRDKPDLLALWGKIFGSLFRVEQAASRTRKATSSDEAWESIKQAHELMQTFRKRDPLPSPSSVRGKKTGGISGVKTEARAAAEGPPVAKTSLRQQLAEAGQLEESSSEEEEEAARGATTTLRLSCCKEDPSREEKVH